MDLNEVLIEAAKDGNMLVLKAALEKGADINAKDKNGWTALMWASKNGHTEVVEFLKERGAIEFEEPEEIKLYPVMVDDKYGYIDETGKVVIEPQFDIAMPFSEGLAPVSDYLLVNWGYIDKTGTFVIKPQFVLAEAFSDGLASVMIGNKGGYIDKTGKFVINPQFDFAGKFSEGLAVVGFSGNFGDNFGYIDKTGRFVIKPQFEAAYNFNEGLAPVKTNRKWGYIDKTGQFVIKPQFDYAMPFSKDLACVIIDDKEGYIDKTGRFVFSWPTLLKKEYLGIFEF